MRGEPTIERLESAGLVAVYFYADSTDETEKALLFPDEADRLAEKLREAAQDVRDV
jgi:hypothetical protein